MTFLSLPCQQWLDPADTCIQQYAAQINTILQIALPKMAQGFSHQSGAMFSFGPKAYEPCETLALTGHF